MIHQSIDVLILAIFKSLDDFYLLKFFIAKTVPMEEPSPNILCKNSINFERAGLEHFSPYNDCLTSRLNVTT